MTRGRLLRGAAALAAASAGGAGAAALAGARSSGALAPHDRDVLKFALELEQLQVAFYDAAQQSGNLTGEASQFAHIVGDEERAHLAYVRRALGDDGRAPAPRYRFGDAYADDHRFIATAVELEQIGLGAYNGQAGNVTPPLLRSLARVTSVEARHVAWARGLAGELPAPHAIDSPLGAEAALRALGRYR